MFKLVIHKLISTVAHLIFTFSYPLRALTSLQLFNPNLSLSLSAFLLAFVSLTGSRTMQSCIGSFLMMWPMKFYVLLRTSSLRFSISTIWSTSLFVILSCQRIYKYPSQTFVLEDVDFVFIAFIHLPRLAVIHQDWLYHCLI